MQARGRRVRRPDPRSMPVQADAQMTSVAGLVDFGSFLRDVGEDRALGKLFGWMKTGRMVVYPMAAQIRTLVDLAVADYGRVFGIEAAASDPLFAHLCGGVVPSSDVLYDDLSRFDETTLALLEEHMAQHGLAPLRGRRFARLHIDIDTSVTPLFGHQEGALPGPNPRYHGRPSYHPILARVAELDTIIGAKLRPGDTSFGDEDIPTLIRWIARLRAVVGANCVIVVRMDAAGDCTELFRALHDAGVHYLVKAKLTPNLTGAVGCHTPWRTVDVDADYRPTRQVATIGFRRDVWESLKSPVRVVAVRTTERDVGKQIYLWDDLDHSVQTYLTNDWLGDEDELAHTYNARAGIEPTIADLKNGWRIGRASSAVFDANHSAFLIKLLAYNLLRRFVVAHYPSVRQWRTPWVRRVLILRPGRIVRSARCRTVRAAPLFLSRE
jgi:DDE family transposase